MTFDQLEPLLRVVAKYRLPILIGLLLIVGVTGFGIVRLVRR